MKKSTEQLKTQLLEEWKKLCYDHEFDYVNDGQKFISSALSQMERQVREEVIEDIEYFADGNFIESRDGAIKKKMVTLDDLHIILESLKKR